MNISSVISSLLIMKGVSRSLDIDGSQWRHGLRRGSATARLLGLSFRIPRWA
jgi:putative lipase involved disintegration of autophagic bodies